MSLKTAPYHYTVLPPSHIRILVLEPSLAREAPLRFNFHVADISTLLDRYEAISYTWGEPRLDFPIRNENGTSVYVTQNLDSALRRMRHRVDERWLWADAICINQTDLQEKSVQVPLMGRIYRGAKQVLVWLGFGRGDEEEGMQILMQLCLSPQHTDVVRRMKSRDPRYISNMTRVSRLFKMPLFSRVWTVQECVLNINSTFICGESELTMAQLANAMQTSEVTWWKEQGGGLAHFKVIDALIKLWSAHLDLTNLQTTNNIYQLTPDVQRSASNNDTMDDTRDILRLVDRFGGHKCSDPRDRVYALCGLASNVKPASEQLESIEIDEVENVICLDVDYSRDTYESFIAFAIACMKSRMLTRILMLAASRPINRMSGWPSWVPDWRISPLYGSDSECRFDYCDEYLAFIRKREDSRIEIQLCGAFEWRTVMRNPTPETPTTFNAFYLQCHYAAQDFLEQIALDVYSVFLGRITLLIKAVLRRCLDTDDHPTDHTLGHIQLLYRMQYIVKQRILPGGPPMRHDPVLPDSVVDFLRHRTIFMATGPEHENGRRVSYLGIGSKSLAEGDLLLTVRGLRSAEAEAIVIRWENWYEREELEFRVIGSAFSTTLPVIQRAPGYRAPRLHHDLNENLRVIWLR